MRAVEWIESISPVVHVASGRPTAISLRSSARDSFGRLLPENVALGTNFVSVRTPRRRNYLLAGKVLFPV